MLLQVMGADFDDKDYVGLSTGLRITIQVYRNSMGDIAPPIYKQWTDRAAESDDDFVPFMIIRTIWLIWFLNQFICMLLLMNFLIAIIADTYN